MKRSLLVSITLVLTSLVTAVGQPQSGAAPRLTADFLRELGLRNIGPALMPGCVADVAVDPRNRSVWYVAMASIGLWKTTNRGLTWRPIFDQGGSYSLGCVTLDPKNSDVVWLGTGENQALRSVSFGGGRCGGPLVKSGKFTATLNKVVNGQTTPLGEPQTFEVVPLPGVPAAGGTRP